MRLSDEYEQKFSKAQGQGLIVVVTSLVGCFALVLAVGCLVEGPIIGALISVAVAGLSFWLMSRSMDRSDKLHEEARRLMGRDFGWIRQHGRPYEE